MEGLTSGKQVQTCIAACLLATARSSLVSAGLPQLGLRPGPAQERWCTSKHGVALYEHVLDCLPKALWLQPRAVWSALSELCLVPE